MNTFQFINLRLQRSAKAQNALVRSQSFFLNYFIE